MVVVVVVVVVVAAAAREVQVGMNNWITTKD